MPVKRKNIPKYSVTLISDVPHSRNGKHHSLIASILSDLDELDEGSAMKIPLKGLGTTKEKLRSALNRATAKQNLTVATASDATHLYVWKTDAN
ncbi:MAG: hypothetical protein ACJ71N_12855 [Terriglobales bacterium]|jgi:hypothetical protein